MDDVKTPQWELDLYIKYPKLFRQKDLPASQTCMCWGVACGEGWKDIIVEACQKLQKYADDNGIVIEFAQIKEKFAGLRMYTDIKYPDDHKFKDAEIFKKEREAIWRDVHEIVGNAEELSYKTCEVCGKPGKPRKGNWISTLCDEHAQGREPWQ